jgi:hypothetical protein
VEATQSAVAPTLCDYTVRPSDSHQPQLLPAGRCCCRKRARRPSHTATALRLH